jgi:hypothetical protein
MSHSLPDWLRDAALVSVTERLKQNKEFPPSGARALQYLIHERVAARIGDEAEQKVAATEIQRFLTKPGGTAAVNVPAAPDPNAAPAAPNAAPVVPANAVPVAAAVAATAAAAGAASLLHQSIASRRTERSGVSGYFLNGWDSFNKGTIHRGKGFGTSLLNILVIPNRLLRIPFSPILYPSKHSKLNVLSWPSRIPGTVLHPSQHSVVNPLTWPGRAVGGLAHPYAFAGYNPFTWPGRTLAATGRGAKSFWEWGTTVKQGSGFIPRR